MNTRNTDGTNWAELLSELPEGWRLLRLKHLAEITNSNVDKKAYEDGTPVRLCNYTDVYYQEFITNDLDLMRATATESEIERFSLQPGDVIITKDSEGWDDIAVPAVVAEELNDVVCGYHLTMLRPEAEAVNGRFLFRALQSSGIREQFHVAAKGITRYGLSQHHIQDVLVPVPPLDEQRQLAAYLDRKTGEIDTLIRKKQSLIALLREQRTALIHRAVTKGLDPDVPMKDSGVEWLGEVPEHWSVEELRRKWEVVDCKHKTPIYVDSGFPVVSTTEVKPGRLVLNGTRFTTKEGFLDMTEGSRLPKRGDIIYSRNASVGSAALVETDQEFCMGQDVCLITSEAQDQRFLTYQLNSPLVLRQLGERLVGATFKRINVEQIRGFLVTRPPANEQKEIAQHLRRKTSEIDVVIDRERSLIEKLRELRTSLISEVVTGKIDVRGEVTASNGAPAEGVAA